MLEIKEITKTYHSKGMDYPVLKGISAIISDGEFVAVMGAVWQWKDDAFECYVGLYFC